MPNVAINFACGLYDRMLALYTGEVRPEGIDLRYLVEDNPRNIFDKMGGELAFDARIEPALFEKLTVGERRGGETARHLHPESGERADHLPERGVLAADTLDVVHAELLERDDVIVHGCSIDQSGRPRVLATQPAR